MTVRQRSLHPHLNSYHYNVSLLFQFILSEYLGIHAEIAPLHKLTAPPRSTEQCEAFLIPVSKLAGASQDYMRFFVWNHESGLLSKFKNYCALFAQKNTNDDQLASKRIILLHQNANQAWLYCMHCLDLLHTLKDEGPNAKTGESLCKTTAKLLTCFSRISKALIPLLETFNRDENVLFFILRHQNELDQIYGEGYSAQLLGRMHPQGLPGIENFLSEQFANRGFNHLLGVIHSKMSQLVTV